MKWAKDADSELVDEIKSALKANLFEKHEDLGVTANSEEPKVARAEETLRDPAYVDPV